MYQKSLLEIHHDFISSHKLLYLLLVSTFSLYLLFMVSKHCLISLWTTSIYSTNSSSFQLLFSSNLMSLSLATPLGCILVTISNGVFPILWFTELYANSSYGWIMSQFSVLSPTKHLSKFTKILFTAFVYPLVCG